MVHVSFLPQRHHHGLEQNSSCYPLQLSLVVGMGPCMRLLICYCERYSLNSDFRVKAVKQPVFPGFHYGAIRRSGRRACFAVISPTSTQSARPRVVVKSPQCLRALVNVSCACGCSESGAHVIVLVVRGRLSTVRLHSVARGLHGGTQVGDRGRRRW